MLCKVSANTFFHAYYKNDYSDNLMMINLTTVIMRLFTLKVRVLIKYIEVKETRDNFNFIASSKTIP